MAASDNSVFHESEQTDPTLFCTAYKRNRFYLFTKREPDSTQSVQGPTGRDIFNEKPQKEEILQQIIQHKKQDVIMHTTFGDIYITLYPQYAPKACENFTQHAKSGLIILTRLLYKQPFPSMHQGIHDPIR